MSQKNFSTVQELLAHLHSCVEPPRGALITDMKVLNEELLSRRQQLLESKVLTSKLTEEAATYQPLVNGQLQAAISDYKPAQSEECVQELIEQPSGDTDSSDLDLRRGIHGKSETSN
ncbi:hypothetical protein K3495_g9364 [Podosphaera aphanis]|nr:hypothetical protein K3495_g9364 [Podosphaera aphanis]